MSKSFQTMIILESLEPSSGALLEEITGEFYFSLDNGKKTAQTDIARLLMEQMQSSLQSLLPSAKQDQTKLDLKIRCPSYKGSTNIGHYVLFFYYMPDSDFDNQSIVTEFVQLVTKTLELTSRVMVATKGDLHKLRPVVEPTKYGIVGDSIFMARKEEVALYKDLVKVIEAYTKDKNVFGEKVSFKAAEKEVHLTLYNIHPGLSGTEEVKEHCIVTEYSKEKKKAKMKSARNSKAKSKMYDIHIGAEAVIGEALHTGQPVDITVFVDTVQVFGEDIPTTRFVEKAVLSGETTTIL